MEVAKDFQYLCFGQARTEPSRLDMNKESVADFETGIDPGVVAVK
jgi:hypothetical protein